VRRTKGLEFHKYCCEYGKYKVENSYPKHLLDILHDIDLFFIGKNLPSGELPMGLSSCLHSIQGFQIVRFFKI
jgi:hypothetical protein